MNKLDEIKARMVSGYREADGAEVQISKDLQWCVEHIAELEEENESRKEMYSKLASGAAEWHDRAQVMWKFIARRDRFVFTTENPEAANWFTNEGGPK